MAIDAEITTYSNREWIVNFETGNVSEPENNLASIAQDVRFILETERYMYPVMGNNFGVTLNDLIGTDYDFMRSEVSSRIKEALSVDDRIISAGDFKFTKTGDSVTVDIIIKTIMGNINATTTIVGG